MIMMMIYFIGEIVVLQTVHVGATTGCQCLVQGHLDMWPGGTWNQINYPCFVENCATH